MASEIKGETVSAVKNGLQANIDELHSTAQKIAKFKDKLENKINSHLTEYDRKKDRFFAFDDIQKRVFWCGCVANIISLGLLMWVIFLRN